MKQDHTGWLADLANFGSDSHYAPFIAGKGKECRLLGAPTPVERITYHAHSAPLHKIKTDNMLPSQLLTPFQVSCCPSLHWERRLPRVTM